MLPSTFNRSPLMCTRLSLFAVTLFATTLTAETRLVLSNGDSLKGEVVRVKEGMVYFDSEALGMLTLPSSGVTIEETDPLPTAAGDTLAPPAEENGDSPAETEEKKPAWEKNIEFGFTMQSGRKDKMDISGRFSAERDVSQDQYRIRARYLYGETRSEKSTDLFDSSFRWRRDLSPRTFTQALTYYGRDTIKRLNHDLSQGVGIGRKLYNLDTLSFSLGGGATARYRDENGDPARMEYMVDAFQDIDYKINTIFTVVQDASVLIEPEDPGNYLVRLNAALIGKITQSITMSMRYEYEYDNSLRIDDRFSQRIITSLGYLF